MVLCKLQGEKNPDPAWVNPFGEMLYRQQARETINPAAAKLFLKLAAAGQIPSWAVSHLDINLIKAAAS